MASPETTVSEQSETAEGRQDVFSIFDQEVMLTRITNTHAPDGRQINVKLLLDVVEDIFRRAVPSVEANTAAAGATETQSLLDANLDGQGDQFQPPLAYLIDRIRREIACKCSSSVDPHEIAISILEILSGYSWVAKLALTLSAFAVTYGEFWLVHQKYTSNELAKTVAILKQLHEILEFGAMKKLADAMKELANAMLDMSQCIFGLSEIPPEDIVENADTRALAIDHIPVAVYRTIRSILFCLTQLTLLGREHRESTIEALEEFKLKLSKMYNHLNTQLCNCRKLIDERKHREDFQNLLHLFKMVHIDNIRVLKALIYQKDDQQPLFDGATKRRVKLEVLRQKTVLLLISDLDISQEELDILQQIYNESRQHPTRHESPYEVVWLPILKPTYTGTDAEKKFEDVRTAMPWYTVEQPKLINRAVVDYIKKAWRYAERPIIVVLDPKGKVVCTNALHMMCIWRNMAFPFTTSMEEALWKEETWELKLLVDDIDPVILNWISEGRYICLYGGEDMEWIRLFTTTATAVARAAGFTLGMVYVGKSEPKERVRRINECIAVEKLSQYWKDPESMRHFWVRLESMWHSKNLLGRNPENDPIMREIVAMLSYDSSEEGWAAFAEGSGEMTRAKGATFLTCLQQYNEWKEQAQQIGFLPALQVHLKKLHTSHHCSRFMLPGTARMTPEKMVCLECGRAMERYIMYRCCDE